MLYRAFSGKLWLFGFAFNASCVFSRLVGPMLLATASMSQAIRDGQAGLGQSGRTRNHTFTLNFLNASSEDMTTVVG